MYSEKRFTDEKIEYHPRQGVWELQKNNTVTYTDCLDKSVQTYTLHTIQIALNNVKNNRTSYETKEAWTNHIAHFEHGRSLFPVNWLTEHKHDSG